MHAQRRRGGGGGGGGRGGQGGVEVAQDGSPFLTSLAVAYCHLDPLASLDYMWSSSMGDSLGDPTPYWGP